MRSSVDASRQSRLGGLRRFAVALTVFNLLGHTVLGFEQSIAQPLVSILASYAMELLLETIDARVTGRRPYYTGGPRNFVDFLLSAHITGLAVAMLLYTNDGLWRVVFAAMLAVGAKSLFRLRVGGGLRHFYNPSNLGISVALLVFPWIGIAPPYHFTEKLYGAWEFILPGLIIISGTMLNARFTRKLPLIGSWLACFVIQAAIRSVLFETPFSAALVPVTGLGFSTHTFCVVAGPGTTSSSTGGQIACGAGVAATYGILMASHAVFGLFFALTIVCTGRGLALLARSVLSARAAAQAPAVVGRPVGDVMGEV